MPANPDLALCPVCDRPVYPAEGKFVASRLFHPICYKCTECNKTLNPNIVCENGMNLFCRQCYKGGFAGVDSKGSIGAPILGATVDNGCPRCGKKVFEAEKLVVSGKDWHNTCARCKTCNMALDAKSMQVQVGEIYCKSCYNRAFSVRGKF